MSNEKPESEIVMYLVFREDLKMTKGKIAAQAGHAVQYILDEISLDRLNETSERYRRVFAWSGPSKTKIALKVADGEALIALAVALQDRGVWTRLVTDEGRTCVDPGTVTCMSIEPLPRDHAAVKDLLSGLKLY